MLQRDTHVSASDNSNATTYTLYAKNNIYNGWDGNQIGFEGSASIVSNISTSINEAWNKTYNTNYIYLGAASRVEVGSTLIQQNANFPFSGSYQEFRYYSAQLPETVFNDYVMNPESIEGINITGPSSSFNLLNFRAALGNELESTFISPALGGGQSSYTSIHPAIVGSPGGIYTTESFKLIATTNSLYTIEYPSASAILPYSTTNTEVYFLDQPAAGVRNRISNKIKIDDGQDYGTTLSSLRSIQQNYQISRSYTEDINSLEVAFSPQDEVNDDIIQTFGFGVISDVLADPRFLSSSDDYYPGLRSIAKEYFEKYSQGNIYDYLRLIKYFDNSIFKAIKNYVPARTSVSTGIVIKQHLLERNRRRPVQLSEVTKIAVTPSGGFNTPIVRENLELTSSIEIGSFSGGTGGAVEKFNYTGSLEFGQLPNTQSWENNIPTVLGLTTITEDSQKEFYDGEYSGSTLIATTQSLFTPAVYTPIWYSLNNNNAEMLSVYSFDFTGRATTDPTLDFRIKIGSVDIYEFLTGGTNSNTDLKVLNAFVEQYDWVKYEINGLVLTVTVPKIVGAVSLLVYENNALRDTYDFTLVTEYVDKNYLYTNDDSNITINVPGVKITTGKIGNLPRLSTDFVGYVGIVEAIITLTENTEYITSFGDISFIDESDDFTNSSYIQIRKNNPKPPKFDPLLNNVSGSRLNSYLMKVEYEKGIVTASNNSQILDRTAQRAAVPDSNYTSKRSILPRYEGSKASSANYNHYTSASSGAEFRDGSTGSWSGDSSYGKTAAIDKNPIYFGHFQKSFNNFSIFNTTDYLLDQLIEVPFEDIKGQNIEPKVIKIEGDNSKLQDVVSTFEKNRKLSAVYESEIKDGINYSLNSINKLPILNPGSKYITTTTNQINNLQTSLTYSYRRFPEEIYSQPAYFGGGLGNNFEGTNTTSSILMVTGSGFLELSGSTGLPSLYSPALNWTGSFNTVWDENFMGYIGPYLSVIHSYNYCLANNIYYSFNILANPPVPSGVTPGIDNTNPNNYYRFNPNSSSLSQYEDINEPFLIERGDEIRVTYASSSIFYTQDFTVLGVDSITYPSFDSLNNYRLYSNQIFGGLGVFYNVGQYPVKLYNKINVYPDPSTLVNQIPSGSIYSFTHRKRKNADNVVNVILPPLEGSNGASNILR
jgi:hypothetical protein